jgi:hypothetical protein
VKLEIPKELYLIKGDEKNTKTGTGVKRHPKKCLKDQLYISSVRDWQFDPVLPS